MSSGSGGGNIERDGAGDEDDSGVVAEWWVNFLRSLYPFVPFVISSN